ncbi:MAG: ATP-grasp domain-containing protein [Candidatus Methylomirabilaceae bacterium]
MKILVHESITGGGLGSSAVAPTLLAEGRMMLEALVADLLRLREHELLLLIDRGRVGPIPRHPRLHVRDVGGDYRQAVRKAVEEVDAVLLLAPETGGLLGRLTALVESRGKFVLGASSGAIACAGDKARTYRALHTHGIPTPETHQVRNFDDLVSLARHLAYPVVLKPIDGAGCQSVLIARRQGELQRAYLSAVRETGQDRHVVQRYIRGVHASVSVLADGVRSLPLTLNRQEIKGQCRLSYHGGRVPLDHPLTSLAFRRAEQVVSAMRGLKGYIGLDVVLTDRDAVVIEVNPRLTTSYVGIRMVVEQNLGAMIIGAAMGSLADLGPIEVVGTAKFSTRSRAPADGGGLRWRP